MTDIKEKKIPVMEMFGPTIQGEGLFAGLGVFFIRFGLCDYKCEQCDSMFAVDPHKVKANASWLTQTQILDQFLKIARPLPHIRDVVLSGGNPCIHELTHLVRSLKTQGYKVHVETQGTKAPRWLHHIYALAISPKGQGMGETFDFEVFHEFLSQGLSSSVISFLKIPVFDQRDLELAAEIKSKYPALKMFLSLGNPYPPDEGDPWETEYLRDVLLDHYAVLAEDILNDPRLEGVSFMPQLHVLVWGNAQGV